MARGNEEEAMERAQRRSREQSLQQEFAASRVRVVDRLGRAFATGDVTEHVCLTIYQSSFSLFWHPLVFIVVSTCSVSSDLWHSAQNVILIIVLLQAVLHNILQTQSHFLVEQRRHRMDSGCMRRQEEDQYSALLD